MSRLSIYEILTRIRKRRVNSSEHLDLTEDELRSSGANDSNQVHPVNRAIYWVGNESKFYSPVQGTEANLAKKFGIRWKESVQKTKHDTDHSKDVGLSMEQNALRLEVESRVLKGNEIGISFHESIEESGQQETEDVYHDACSEDDNVDSQKCGDNITLDNECSQADFPRCSKPVGPLESYLNIMESVGVSIYRRDEYPRRSKLAHAVLKGVFWAFTIFALANTCLYLKYQIFQSVSTSRDLRGCVRVGFALLPCFNRPLIVRLLAFSRERMSVMLLHIRQMFQVSSAVLNEPSSKFTKTAGLLAFGTSILTITATLFGYANLKNYTFQDSFFSRAYVISVNLLAWGSKNYTEAITDDLFKRYYLGNVTPTSVALGGASAAFDFCSILQGETIKDLIILAILVLNNAWSLFESKIESHFLVAAKLIPADQLIACLELYKAIRQAGDSINYTIGTVFKFLVMQDLFQYAYPCAVALSGDDFDMLVYHTILDLVKTTLVFFISLKIHGKNETAGKWLRRLTTYMGPVDIPDILDMTVEAAIDDLNQRPIAFGTGYFLINETFLVAYFTMILSCVALMVEDP